MDLYKKFKEEFDNKKGNTPEYLIGLKHNLLTVVDFRRTPSGFLRWICKCECGKKATIRSKSDLLKRKGCQSCTASLSSKAKKGIAHYAYYRRKYKEYKDGASKRHLDFFITFEEFLNLVKSSCYYCGIPAIIKPIVPGNGAWKVSDIPLLFNGLDRKNSEIGYTLDNVVSCCSDCNYGKHVKNESQFIEWINRVYRYQKSSKTISQESTLQVNGSGNGNHPEKDDDIV